MSNAKFEPSSRKRSPIRPFDRRPHEAALRALSSIAGASPAAAGSPWPWPEALTLVLPV
jgi:hypothetical protein